MIRDDGDRSGRIMWAIILAVVAAILAAALVADWIDCDERGGTYVETPLGYACIGAR